MKLDPSNTFLISDTHFGDGDILRYENRPFDTVGEMDSAMIRNIEFVLAEDSHIFFLGDLSNYKYFQTKEVVEHFMGTKHLILGNHDIEKGWDDKHWMDIGFKYVYHFPICINGFYWLSHEPMYLNGNMPYANIHGHIHGNKLVSTSTPNQYVNVSVEHIDYTPISLSDIQVEFKRRDSNEGTCSESETTHG